MNITNVCKAKLRMSLLISVITILFTLLSGNASAGNNYYFSTSTGDDSRTPSQAKNQATPWKTINKLNSYFSSLLPGDYVLFKSGETFYGTIEVNKSGTSALPIVIGSYGTGEKPIITGLKTISGWTNLGGNIWESSATDCKSTLNMVTLDGNIQLVGRFPNTTLLTYESFTGSSKITDNQLTNSPNWTGAEVVIRANPYNWIRYPITSHSTTVITYSGSSYTGLTANFGYYFQRDPKTLDLNGEWYLNPTTKKLRMYFSDNNPNAHVVKASTLDYVVYQNSYQNNRSYIRFENLSFEGGNESNIIINGTSTNNTILNCTSNYSGKNGITTSGLTNAAIKNCTVNNSLSTGILHSGNNAAITGNTVTKSGILFGMSQQNGGGCGIEIVSGTGNTIQFNHINSTGKHGIFLRGNNSIIKNNLVEYTALTHDDVGGIYTTGSYINSKIIGNIVLYTIGDKTGCTNANISVEGIYLDAPHTGVYVEGNTVAHSGRGGIRYHNAWNVTARYNTLYDNPVNIMIVKSALGTSYSYNQNIKNNISVCKTSSQLAFWIYNYFDGNPLTFGTSDSNYFARPILDTNPIRTSKPGNDTHYTLEQWKSASGKDLHSHKSPQSISNENEILFEYNATQSNKTISFSGNYKGINGTIYTNSTVLLPYTSIVLLKMPVTTNQPPSIQNQGFQLNENSPNGTTVGTVLASDPNTGQILTYSILSGNTNGAFTIGATTGIVKVANTAALNFEVNPSITLVVKVQDNGTGNLVSQANVTVTLINLNEAPLIVNQSFSVTENSSIGSQVGTVVASDPDAGQTKAFSILSGNTNSAFAINSSTGILTVANSSALNIASTPIFSLIIKVQDNGTGNLSSQATATINILSVGNCSATGNISYQVWNNIGSGISVANLTGNINYPDNPSSTALITSMEALNNQFDNFGARIAGYICAPATGSYTFWIASDDNGELWLSTNSLPANKQKIAYHTGFTASRQWNKYATQKSAVINLIQGQSYYIEALMKEGTGGDNFAIGWLKPGQSGTEPSEIVPGTALSPIASAQLLVTNVNVQASGSVSIGAAFTPTATVLPGNATNSILSWTSSNSLIASVNNMGQVVGLTPGTVSIKATSTDGSNKSGTCLVTVNNPSCSAVGNISYQVWNNIGSGLSVANLTSNINFPNNPTSNLFIPSMEAAGNQFDNFGARIVGYICAPATGSYTFWIASDDYSELWLSTTEQSIGKQKIAFHNGFTFSREWNKYATQKSVVINLVQGRSYYIEALMKDGSGGDNFAVGWIKPGQTGNVPSEIIPGSVLSPDGSKSIEAHTENINVSEQEIGLLVYPNPISDGELTIKVENAPPLVELNIYTISGVKCYSALIKNSEIIKIDKTLFKSGIYVVKIFNEQFVKTTKLIVN